MKIISKNENFSLFPKLSLLTMFMIICIEYVKQALIRGLTAHDCGGLQLVEAPGQVPTLPSPKSGPDNTGNTKHHFRYTTVPATHERKYLHESENN